MPLNQSTPNDSQSVLPLFFEKERRFLDPEGSGIVTGLISSSSSSSYRAGSTDIPDPLSPLLPIVHRPR